MTDLLAVGRIKDSPDGQPRFTASLPIGDLLAKVAEHLPVDLLYFVSPHEDGLGFSLREIGRVVLDIIPPDQQEAPHVPTTPPQEPVPAPAQAKPSPKPVLSKMEDFTFGQEEDLDPFKFAKPKSQAELLAERGLETAPTTKKAKPSERKGKVESLPHPVSLGSTRQVTGIIEATPAQAEAASHFGEKN